MNDFKPWRVLHLSLGEAIPDLPAEPDGGGIYAVIWWDSLPLGHMEIPAQLLPIPSAYVTELVLAAITPAVGDHLLDYGFEGSLPLRKARPRRAPDFDALKRIDRPLEQLRNQWHQLAAAPRRTISVVICTRNRPEELARCLRSIEGLSEPPQEVIVVDNSPQSDAAYRVVRSMPDIRYVLERRPGLSRARNAGWRAASRDIVAFTDDDVEVHPDWLTRLRLGFRDPEVMAVCGLVLTAEIDTLAQLEFHRGNGGFGWGFRALTFDGSFFEESKARGVPVWHIGAGSNMAFRREFFSRVGPFDERLGAGAAGCSEDSEMWYRVLAEGGRCRYEPAAVVFHHHREQMHALRSQMYQYMRGHVTALLVQFERYGDWGNLWRAFGILPAYYAKLLLERVLRSNTTRMSTLRAEMLGSVAGLRYYWRNRRPS